MAFTKREAHGRVKPAWRQASNKPEGRMIGIEFEVEHRGGFQRILDALPEPKEEKNRPVTESDGSLDHSGVEIVFPPYKNMALKQTDPKRSYFAKAMKALEDAGVHVSTNCGMHMNINTTGWEDSTRRSFMVFMHYMPPTWMTRIGGRGPNGYCTQYRAYVTWNNALQHTEHVTAAGVRPNRIEVRWPKPTTDMVRIKNLTNFFELVEDYCKARVDFVRTTPAEYDLSRDFIEWLDANKERPRTSATIKDILLNGYPA